MERIEGPQTPYEVYCYNCRTTFAAGTRSCVHCGNRILSNGPGPASGSMQDILHPDDEGEGEDEGEVGESFGKRLASMGVWILIVVGASLMRLCNGD